MPTILGIDPGTHRLGWGVISGTAHRQSYIASGCIESSPGTQPHVYLPYIAQRLSDIIKTHKPDLVGLESLLFQKNVKTALSVAEARGVVLLKCAESGIAVRELAPNTIKSAVAGSGSATKAAVTRMIGLLLRIDVHSRLDDELDALATAIAAITLKL